jgi:iron complex transport system substrate-binding protein
MKQITGLLILFLLISGIGVCSAAYPVNQTDPSIQEALTYLHTCQKDDGGFGETGRESSPGTTSWAIMAIAGSGEDPRTWVTNGNSTVDYMRSMNKEIVAKGGTPDFARTILTLQILGEDPRTFAGTDYVALLKDQMKSNGQAGDHVYTTVWALMALATTGENTSATVQWLTSQQNQDGGFPWTPGTDSDPDDTGSALMALASAGVSRDDAVMQKAVNYLKNGQLDDGGFCYGGTSASNSASDAWVIQGLVAAGEDPSTISKAGKSVVDHLQGLENANGSFRYTGYVIDNPCRMTASAIPALLGEPYPILPGQVPNVSHRSTSFVTASTITSQATTSFTTPATPTISPSRTTAGGRTVTVTDDYNATVTIQGQPQRIVSLGPSNTEILYALGLQDRVVGVTDYCNYPKEAQEKAKVGGYSTVNIEKVVALQPDLVIAAYGNTEDVITRLRSMGLTVITLNPLTIDDVFHDIELVGTATGKETEATTCVTGLEKRVQAVKEKTANLTNRPSVAQVVWYDPIWVSGNETFENELIEQAGGTNAFNATSGWTIVGLEQFITTNPEYIIVNSGTGMGDSSYDIITNYIKTEPRMQNLTAVRQNQVYTINADIISRGGPRIVDALEEVAADLHPDVFGNNTTRQTETVAQSPGFGWAALAVSLGVVALFRRRE